MASMQMIHLREWATRNFAWILLALIELLLAGFVAIPFLRVNNLLRHDLVGHLASAAFTEAYLFPSVSGYNPFYFCGAPQNLLYPPLLSYLSAALGRLIGVKLGLKILVVGAVLATPLATYCCARAHSFTRSAAAVATLAVTAMLALDREELGGNFFSTFEIGNAANALGLPLFLAYAAALARCRQRPRAIALPSVLLALNLVTHLVGGLVAILLLGMHGVAQLYSPSVGWRFRTSVWVILHATWAIALASFFIWPMLLYREFGSPDNRSYNQYPDSLLLLLVGGGLLVLCYASRRQDRHEVGPLVLLSGLLLWSRNFVFNDIFPYGWGLHVHRFKLYDAILLILLAVWLIDGWMRTWSALRRSLVAAGATLLTSAGIVVGLCGIDARGVAEQATPKLPRLSSRVMVMSSPGSQVSDHTVQHLVPMRSGDLVGKGLFIETAANARFLLDLEMLLAADASQVRTWGIELDPPTRLDLLRPELRKVLALFGFGFVLSNDSLHSDSGLFGLSEVGAGFKLYRASYAELAEVWGGGIDAVSDREFLSESRRWFFGNHERLAVSLKPGQALPTRFNPDAIANSKVRSARVSAKDQNVIVEVDAAEPVPVLVKVTYAPQFSASDESGNAIPIYRVTPNFMLVIGRGRITLRYAPTPLQRRATVVSLVAALLLVGVGLGTAFGRRRADEAVTHHG